MALGTRVRVSHGIRHAIIGSLSSVVGVFVAFGVANAELPDAEFSQDPNQQVLNQIMGMMVQEKAAISALSSDRLAELSGFRVPTPAGSDAGMSSLSLFGLKLGVEQDQDAIKLAAAAQNGNLSVDLGDHSAAGFTKAVLDSMPNVSGDRQWQCLTEALYFEADRILSEEVVAIIPLHGYERNTLVKTGVTFEFPPFGSPAFQHWALP